MFFVLFEASQCQIAFLSASRAGDAGAVESEGMMRAREEVLLTVSHSAAVSSPAPTNASGAADIVALLASSSATSASLQQQQQQQKRLPFDFRFSAVPLPVFLVLLSPWMDLEGKGASHRTNADVDYLKVS